MISVESNRNWKQLKLLVCSTGIVSKCGLFDGYRESSLWVSSWSSFLEYQYSVCCPSVFTSFYYYFIFTWKAFYRISSLFFGNPWDVFGVDIYNFFLTFFYNIIYFSHTEHHTYVIHFFLLQHLTFSRLFSFCFH